MKFAFVFAIAAATLFSVNAAPAAKKAAPAPQPTMISMTGLKATKTLTVLKAAYGIKGKSMDVTKIVADSVKAKKDFKAGYATFKKDPAFGKGKKLEVVYSVNGQIKFVSFPENANVKVASFK